MPEHESLFSLFGPRAIFENIENLTRIINVWVTGDDTTWMAHESYGHGGADVQHVVGALFVFLLLAILAGLGYRRLSNTASAIVPESSLTPATVVELFTEAVFGMMAGIMGKKNARVFLPLIGTCAFFIFFSNVLGLIPGFLPPTSSLKTTAACAVVIFLSTHVFGLKENGFGHIKHLFGPVSVDLSRPATYPAILLMALMFVIEVISHLARPLSLSLRLMANMFADHLVLGVFTGLIPFLVPVPIMLLGTLVVGVQTLVFCILSTVYIGLAIEHQDHGDAHEGHGHEGEAHAH